MNLNLPVAHNLATIPDIMETFSKKHFLSGLLLKQVAQYLNHKDKAVRTKALLTMKALLRRHSLDLRYQEANVKERIAAIYFPFILMVPSPSSLTSSVGGSHGSIERI